MPSVIDELVTILGIEVDGGVGKTLQTFNAGLDSVTRFAGWAGAALIATAGSIAYFTERTAESTAELDKFHQLTGISTDNVQGLMHAVEQVGGEADNLKSDLMGLTKSMSSPVPGEFNHTLFMMGVNVRKSNGEIKKADEILLDVADKMKGMSSIEQLQWGSKIGLSDDTILLLQEGREAIEGLQQQAADIPTIVNKENIRNAREFITQMKMIRRVITYISQEATSAAGPALKSIVKDMTQWLKMNREFIQMGLRNFIEGIVSGFKRFGYWIKSIKEAFDNFLPGVGKFIEGFTDMQVISSVVFAILSSLAIVIGIAAAKFIIIGAAITAVALAFEDFIVYLQGGESVFGSLIEWTEKLYEKFSNRFPALSGFLGDLAEVLKGSVLIAVDAVKNSFDLLWEGLKMIGGGLVWLLDKINSGLGKMGYGTKSISDQIQDNMKNMRESSDSFLKGFVKDAQNFNLNASAQINAPKVKAGINRGSQKTIHQKTEVKNDFHITGSNAQEIADAASEKMEMTMHKIFPGGLAPVVD